MDLKSANIFLGRNYVPKIGDFGWSTKQGEQSLRQAYKGEQFHMPPESFSQDTLEADPKMDIWSLGVLLFEMLHFELPFQSDSVVKLEKLISKGKFQLREDLPPKARDLIELMLDPDQEKRPTINSILHHSFFHELRAEPDRKEGKGFIDHFKEAIRMNSFAMTPYDKQDTGKHPYSHLNNDYFFPTRENFEAYEALKEADPKDKEEEEPVRDESRKSQKALRVESRKKKLRLNLSSQKKKLEIRKPSGSQKKQL